VTFIMEANVAIDRCLEEVPLPASWPHRVRSSILRVISLANLAIIYSRSWAANSSNSRVRLQGKLEHARSDISLLTEELRIKDVRMAHVDPHRRPYYRPTERLETCDS